MKAAFSSTALKNALATYDKAEAALDAAIEAVVYAEMDNADSSVIEALTAIEDALDAERTVALEAAFEAGIAYASFHVGGLVEVLFAEMDKMEAWQIRIFKFDSIPALRKLAQG